MPLSLPYTALITVDDLRRDALRSSPLALTSSPGSKEAGEQADAAVQAIIDATDAIERHLDRKLIVRAHVQALCYGHFVTRPRDRYEAWARHYPLVQIVTEGYTTGHEGLTFVSDGPQEEDVAFFAGYRRPDQVLSAPASGQSLLPTQAEEPLEGLTVLPEELPGSIRRACTELALYYLTEAMSGTVGKSRTMQQTGSGHMATVEAADTRFVERVLSRLVVHRRAV